jgi:hypothetical protein
MILCSRSARRGVRVIAGVVATLLVTGNVLVAAGLCILKYPPAVQAASEAPCPQHLVDKTVPQTPAVQHCPGDDSSAQARTADLPSAQVLAAAAVAPFGTFAALAARPAIRTEPASPQRPLYTRLQRLQL